jgi:maltooligosyltrehalose trehalohydrolase
MPAEAGTHTSLGARLVAPNRCQFRVWSPQREQIELHIVAPKDRRVPMRKNASGYHEATVDTGAGTRYFFTVEGNDRPDPASRYQPDGVHGASEVVSDAFAWHDGQWKGIALEDYVIYELHVGTFTPEGTFDAIIPKLDALKELGITAVELLPIAQFPGTRNWGYDGTYVGAAQNSYGGPLALKRLIDAAHTRSLALILDVVYNHLGPEGNYLSQFGPYFTDRYKTAWGSALNFDGPHSDEVRWFFIHNALMWIDEFHFDALRVDAVHAIVDHSAEPFLQDLTTAVRDRGSELGRHVYTIAESNLNDPRVIAPKEQLGLGFDSQWSDDFHHSVHALLTGERAGYYVDYGKCSDLARVLSTGYLFTGQHSDYRGRKYGLKPNTSDGMKFVVSAQNHDQTGNRMMGERLSSLVSYEKLRIAAAAVILSPFLPMIFMGEEYGEKAPFQYFTSHTDDDLIDAVRRGRIEEFEEFAWEGEAPDPHADETFLRSKLTWKEDATLRDLYRALLRLRRETPALRNFDIAALETRADDERRTLLVRRDNVLLAFNFGDQTQRIDLPRGRWKALIETGAKIDGNRMILSAESFALFADRGPRTAGH